MITVDNYYDATKNFIWGNFPEALQKGHEYIDKATEQGQTWAAYHSSESIKKVIDLYLTKLNQFPQTGGPGASAKAKNAAKPAAATKPPKSEKKKEEGPAPAAPKKHKSTAHPTTHPDDPNKEVNAAMVERIPEELRMIKRFIGMNGKNKEKEAILRFINSLQKAIVEKRIRKTSEYADQIRYIQDKLISVYNSMKARIKIELKPETYEEMKSLTGEQKVLPSINFIKRYIGLNGKTGIKGKASQLLTQINRAMDKGQIRDNDPYIDEIHTLKKHLKTFTTSKAQKSLEIEKAALNGLNGMLHSLDGMSQGRLYNTREKKLKAIRKKGNIVTFKEQFYPRGTDDPGRKQIIVVGTEKHQGAIRIVGSGYDSNWYRSVDDLLKAIDWNFMERSHALDGLDCTCQTEISGTEESPTIMNSMDFANMEFTTIGLKGKWQELMGDPSPNFTAMVFGKPKMGKSYLCVDFAGYMARHHGKVLYVAKEEGLDMTLQKKLADKDVVHPNLFVSSDLPTDLQAYDFIFLDSVNRLNLSPGDLNELKSNNPSKSFIFIFQTTKAGNFKGANSFQHDVDVVIEIPEKGTAIQNGRFNQGGQIRVF